jgi:hypothetical protein
MYDGLKEQGGTNGGQVSCSLLIWKVVERIQREDAEVALGASAACLAEFLDQRIQLRARGTFSWVCETA